MLLPMDLRRSLHHPENPSRFNSFVVPPLVEFLAYDASDFFDQIALPERRFTWNYRYKPSSACSQAGTFAALLAHTPD
jgi:hypothetical protein